MTHRISTIKDVAAAANVSTATVSNVLHGKDTLYTPETARMVRDAVCALGYRPNRIARSLVRRQTDTLGVVIDRPHGRLTRSSYMSALLDGFLEQSVAAGYQLKLISLLMNEPHEAMAQLEDGSVDGLALFAPPDGSPLLDWAAAAPVPIVVAGSVPANLPFPAVDMDDREAAHLATTWLIAQGHQRIGLVTGPQEQWSARRRAEGYALAMQEAHLPVRPEWSCTGNYTHEIGASVAPSVLRIARPPTALLCWNDWVALSAMRAIQEEGLGVPEHVSLIGFDDIELAVWTRPSLTTMRQPVHEIGAKAAEILIHQIRSGSREEGIVLFQGELIVRQSTRVNKE